MLAEFDPDVSNLPRALLAMLWQSYRVYEHTHKNSNRWNAWQNALARGDDTTPDVVARKRDKRQEQRDRKAERDAAEEAAERDDTTPEVTKAELKLLRELQEEAPPEEAVEEENANDEYLEDDGDFGFTASARRSTAASGDKLVQLRHAEALREAALQEEAASRHTSYFMQAKRIKLQLLDFGALESVTFISHDICDGGWKHYDVRHFKDMNASHDGRNPIVWEHLVTNNIERFDRLCEDVRFDLNTGKRDVTVNFYCDYGRNVSVACAHIFAMILRTWREIKVTVEHKALGKHPERRCSCDDCDKRGQEFAKPSLVKLFQLAGDL